MKTINLVLLAGATVSLLVFSLICEKVIPYSKALLYFTCALGGFCVNGTIPMFFELSVESTYPVPEGITSGFLTFSNNFIQIIFYIFPMLPHFGTRWINWCTLGSTAISIPLLMIWKERYYRSDVDKKGKFPVDNKTKLSQEAMVNGKSDVSGGFDSASINVSEGTNTYGSMASNSLGSTADNAHPI